MTDLPANITAVAHQIDAEARRRRFGHQGGVVWLPGFPARGKVLLAWRWKHTCLPLV